MKKVLFLIMMAAVQTAFAQTKKMLDLCEKNTSSSYKVYNTATSIPAGTTLTVRTSRYTDFYPVLTGKGKLELYCGGERSYLGNHSDKSYPNWNNFTGDVDIYPYKAVDGSAGFYGVIMNTNGKSYSPEDANPGNKINTLLYNNKTTLKTGAAIATEKSAAGIRIGELNTEAGSRLYGYYKSQSAASSAYYLVGSLGTDATLAGRIASIEKSGQPDGTQTVGIIKEGKGTYTITANDNQISGAVRVNEGTLLINNDAKTAKSKKYTGGTGAAGNTSLPVAYVFKGATLGGNGNIGGHVDLYGKLAPGSASVGTLYLANYATSALCNLTVHPASVINCSITDAETYTSLDINGKINRSTIGQDFVESSASPQIVVSLSENHSVKVGDTFPLVYAKKGRADAGVWFFKVVLPSKLGWKVSEVTGDDGSYTMSVTCTSLEDGGGNGGSGSDDEGDGEDGEDVDVVPDDVPGSDVSATLKLRKYLEMFNPEKRIGVALPSWWRYAGSPSVPPAYLSTPITTNFNLLVAENEMKMDALEPGQNYFAFDDATRIVNYARSNKMAMRGHTLVWHQQVPEWISKDGKANDKNWTKTQLLKILETHITNCVKKFGTNVCEWDVVNETLDDDQSIVRTNPNGYKLRQESVWVKVIGESFIDSAFVYAHRANPDAKLYLNDYGCEFAGSAKTTALFNLAKRLKSSGIPIDGVGLQCHLNINDFNKANLSNTVKRYATIGLNCIFTEIDIAVYSQTTADLNKQADIYKQITEVFLMNDNCPHMVLWGVSDQHSWIADRFPLLFDNNIKEKPAYYAVQKVLRNYVATDIPSLQSGASHNGSPATPLYRYTPSGQRISTPRPGINIVQMSDGSVVKEMR